MNDITTNTDFTKLTDAELIQIIKKWDPVSDVYLEAVSEQNRRREIKEQKINRTQIVIIVIAALGLTVSIISLLLSFYKK